MRRFIIIDEYLTCWLWEALNLHRNSTFWSDSTSSINEQRAEVLLSPSGSSLSSVAVSHNINQIGFDLLSWKYSNFSFFFLSALRTSHSYSLSSCLNYFSNSMTVGQSPSADMIESSRTATKWTGGEVVFTNNNLFGFRQLQLSLVVGVFCLSLHCPMIFSWGIFDPKNQERNCI